MTAFLPGRLRIGNYDIDLLVEIEICEDSINDFNKNTYDKNNAEYYTNKFIVIKIIDEYCNEFSIATISTCTKNEKFIVEKTVKLHETVLCSPDIPEFEFFIKCYLTKKRALYKKIKNTTSIFTYYKDGRVKENIKCKSIMKYNYIYNDAISLLKRRDIGSGEYLKWNEYGELEIHDFYENGEIKNSLINDYEKTETLVNDLVLNKYEKGDEVKFNDVIKMLTSKLSKQNTIFNKKKYLELIFRFLNSEFSMEIIKKKEYKNYRIGLLDSIKNYIKNEVFLTSKSEKLFLLMNEINNKIVTMNN